jgi:hypothetical protein
MQAYKAALFIANVKAGQVEISPLICGSAGLLCSDPVQAAQVHDSALQGRGA